MSNSITPTKFAHDRALIICEKYGDTLSHDDYDALALVAIAYDAGTPITQAHLYKLYEFGAISIPAEARCA